jgi:putative salt-induced outer membrane protein YdiY
VVSLQEDKLVFETSYAGEITINWSEVANLRTDNKITVVLTDDTSIRGVAEPTEDREVTLKVDDIAEPVAVHLADVKSINPPSEPAVKWTIRLNSGLKRERGNTDTADYHLDGELVARTKQNRFTAYAEWDREEDNGKRTSNSALGSLKYDHFLTEKWYLYIAGHFEKDTFADLNLRSTLGGGAGYQIFETPKMNLSVEAGPSYVNEDYIEADDNSYTAGRWALNFDRYLIEDRLQFFHRHMIFVSGEDTSDWFLNSRSGLRVPLYKRLNVTAQYNYDRDNNPSPGDEKEDKTYLLTLGYHFK